MPNLRNKEIAISKFNPQYLFFSFQKMIAVSSRSEMKGMAWQWSGCGTVANFDQVTYYKMVTKLDPVDDSVKHFKNVTGQYFYMFINIDQFGSEE